jgi:UDP-2-acetamido-2,6-beta-L-arabino-hexul-4-ose reductase
MKILVTGAEGFIGKNLTAALRNIDGYEIFSFRSKDDEGLLRTYCLDCDFVFHLAGVNRPENEADFEKGNAGFTQTLVDCLLEGSRCPVVFSSSIQAELDNSYGRSKYRAEEILREYERQTNTPVYLYRLPNVFGKWCRPNYNSVIATFCYNTAHDLPIYISNADQLLHLVYIDDVVTEFIRVLNGTGINHGNFYQIPEVYEKRLGDIADIIQSFSHCTETLTIPDQSDTFTKKLHSTYLSYLPNEKIQYSLITHSDARGTFAEFLRTQDRGQFSINVTKPGFTKGNHWHHTKHEIFLSVSGKGIVRLRKIDESSIIELPITGDCLEPVIIPPGYTHSLENTGESDLITIMWASEPYNPQSPDTYHLAVLGEV